LTLSGVTNQWEKSDTSEILIEVY